MDFIYFTKTNFIQSDQDHRTCLRIQPNSDQSKRRAYRAVGSGMRQKDLLSPLLVNIIMYGKKEKRKKIESLQNGRSENKYYMFCR